MSLFRAIGADCEDTRRHQMAGEEQWFGPLGDHGAAQKEWTRYACHTVDSCANRRRMERGGPDVPPSGAD